MPRTFTLTAAHVAAHAGGAVVALDASAIGRAHRLYSRRPGPERNQSARAALTAIRGETIAEPIPLPRAEPEPPQNDVLLVRIEGPIAQRACANEPSGSWCDGHDAIYDRLAAAFEIGDVVLCLDSPGGAVAGMAENLRRAQEMKAKHGRRCLGHSEGLCASAAFWWAVGICDEFFVSADAKAGSIGARGMLSSVAGMLAQDGISVVVLEDPEGKAAGVPELPISEEARVRAQRDVSIAADMFRAAVAGSPLGMRSGLTPDYLRSLRGDALTGQAAVNAGLADGVATLEDVITYALATAGGGAAAMPEPMKDDEKEKPEGEKPEPGESPEDEGEGKAEKTCATCGDKPIGKGRFCAGCGTKFAEEDEPEEGPPSSRRDVPPAPKKDEGRASAIVPPAARQASSVAAMLGLKPDASHPAVMGALSSALRVVDHAAQITGKADHGEIIGGLTAIAGDAAKTAETQRRLADEKRKTDAAERLSLCKRAAAVEGRDGWLDDHVSDRGVRSAIPGIKGRHTPLAELRGYVEAKEKNADPKRRNPFEPSGEKAREANDAAAQTGPTANPTPAQIEAAKKLPAVINAASRPGAPPIEQLAAAHVASFGVTVTPGA